jgi:UDP-glucose 4-epimerase
MSPYAASKLIGEIYCQTFYRAYGVPTTCLRYFNVYGPRQDPNGEYAAVIPKFVQRIKQAQPPIIYGDGLQTRDFVQVTDVVNANLLACEREDADGQVLNVASGRGVSLLGLVAALNELCNTNFTPQFEPARLGDVRHSRGDSTRLATVLGFEPAVSLVAGLQQMVSQPG